MENHEIKAPQDVVLDLPQERITGDVLRGRGPRRGNLERLLRYWRPIMKKPGGFRRCKVILADHPELYPLNNICAWLHHETTGLWPNEGCHHPGMKNCRKKMKKLKNWSDAEFANNLRDVRPYRGPLGKKSLADDFFFGDALDVKSALEKPEYNQVVTTSDYKHAFAVLRDFVEMEPDFCAFLRDNKNWEIEGEDESGKVKTAEYVPCKDCGDE